MSFQFMSWTQYCKEIYLGCPSCSPAHVQGYILVTRHFMQDQQLWLLNQKLVMSCLNFMWCLMMGFLQFHSWGEVEYPQIGKILCNSDHKVLHKIILTSSIIGSLHILRKIPKKLQLMCQDSHQKITELLSHHCILYNKYKKLRLSRESQSLQ